MNARMRLVCVLAVAVTAVVGSQIYASRERTKDRDEAANLAQAIADADQTGNHVVNARRAGEKPFTLAVRVGKEERPVYASEPAIPLQDAEFCVVFVHGYNTSFATGIREGNTLWAEISSRLQKDTLKGIRFFSFCWRGDYGVVQFDAANNSARRTALAFAYFLKTLARTPPASGPRKIIVVTHSLGALLALHSLYTIERALTVPLVDVLVMIQPAVKIELLGRATIRGIYSVPRRGRLDSAQLEDYAEMPPYQNNGMYFDTIAKATRLTLATSSSGDGVLNWAFHGWARGIQGDRLTTWPVNRIALGTLTKDHKEGWTFPKNLKVFDLTSNPKGPSVGGKHGSVFDPKNPALRRFLINEVVNRLSAGP